MEPRSHLSRLRDFRDESSNQLHEVLDYFSSCLLDSIDSFRERNLCKIRKTLADEASSTLVNLDSRVEDAFQKPSGVLSTFPKSSIDIYRRNLRQDPFWWSRRSRGWPRPTREMPEQKGADRCPGFRFLEGPL
ncbi:hypothetical protein KM043_011231 [Ampulex compressa]|nr:hypothetical protein KM043_011231 [Ampulex compressa]